MRIVIFILSVLIPSISFAAPTQLQDIPNTSIVMQDLSDDTNPQCGGDVDVNGFAFYDDAAESNKYNVPQIEHTLQALAYGMRGSGSWAPLTEFRVKAVNFSGSGGGGMGSGCTYIPVVGLWACVDNNGINIDLFKEGNVASEWGNWDLLNFTDPEWVSFVGLTFDANSRAETVMLAIGEETCPACPAGSQQFVLCEIPVNTATQNVDKNGASCDIIQPSGMWNNDGSLGWEAGCYDPFRKILWGFKQDTPFEARAIPMDGTAAPVATEPWDAEALLSATLFAINDCTIDWSTRTMLMIGDQHGGADNNNQDIVRIDQNAGTLLENWQSYVDTLGLNINTRTDWSQGEAIAISYDGKTLFIGSETDNVAILERVGMAGYYHDIFIDPADAVLDDGAPPALSVAESTGTGTPRRNILSFDSTTDEAVYLTFTVPSDFRVAGNPIILETYWYAASTTATDDAIWSTQLSATTPADADSMTEDATAAVQTVSTNVNTTENNRLLVSSISMTTDDSVATGDIVTIRFSRDADNTIALGGGDGLAVDANVVGWRLRIPKF